MIELSDASGYLVTAPTDVNSPSNCYWRVTVQKGQTINIDLFDFSLSDRYSMDEEIDQMSEVQYCHVYAEIRETDTTRQFTICAGNEREHRVFTSSTHSIEIFVNPVSGSRSHPVFMLKYEGKSHPLMNNNSVK